MKYKGESRGRKITKGVLLGLLVLFSGAAIVFSLVVLFGEMGRDKQVTPAQARGMFTVFIHDYIDEIHPQRPAVGSEWVVSRVEFKNKNFAVVEANDGATFTTLEFIYVIEAPNVRVFKINDITGRDLQDAHLALIRFLMLLHDGLFNEAATLYGGSLSRLQPYGSGSFDTGAMLANYCKRVGPAGQCPEFTVSEPRHDPATNSYRFSVGYLLPDGTAYVRNDGARTFAAIVEPREGDTFVVVTLPFD